MSKIKSIEDALIILEASSDMKDVEIGEFLEVEIDKLKTMKEVSDEGYRKLAEENVRLKKELAVKDKYVNNINRLRGRM